MLKENNSRNVCDVQLENLQEWTYGKVWWTQDLLFSDGHMARYGRWTQDLLFTGGIYFT